MTVDLFPVENPDQGDLIALQPETDTELFHSNPVEPALALKLLDMRNLFERRGALEGQDDLAEAFAEILVADPVQIPREGLQKEKLQSSGSSRILNTSSRR